MCFRFDCQIQIYFIKVIGINDNIDNLKAISKEKSRKKLYFKYYTKFLLHECDPKIYDAEIDSV